ncbi:hypothetical protein [Elongatibacter sediminis]|uniref:Uncharacterized protein n=1 Tax=Elongatibacter sediminis TaxID=3119006 RepID=A0AAW9RL01_9GAMM
MKRFAIVVGMMVIVTGGLFSSPAHAVDVLTSGEDTFLVIDVDGDGPDEEQDCRFLVELSGSRYTATPVQSPVTLRACTGNLMLDLAAEGQDSSSDWAELNMSASGVQAAQGDPGFPTLSGILGSSYEVEIIDESGSPDGRPFDVNWIRFEDPPGGDNVKSEMFICENGGPVLAMEVLDDLLTVHLPFVPWPTANSPTHYSIKSVPWERADPNLGTFVNHDVYLPVNAGHFTVANENSSGNPFIDIDMNSLTSCSSLTNLDPPAFQINSAISDSWYLPTTAGQGFFIIVWEDRKTVFMGWYTYDTERPPEDATAVVGEPGHRWLVAVGPYDGDTATLDVFNASGMVFDSTTPPVMEDQLEGASIVIRWSNCRQATLIYNIPTLGLMGEIHIERIVDDNVPACEAQQES